MARRGELVAGVVGRGGTGHAAMECGWGFKDGHGVCPSLCSTCRRYQWNPPEIDEDNGREGMERRGRLRGEYRTTSAVMLQRCLSVTRSLLDTAIALLVYGNLDLVLELGGQVAAAEGVGEAESGVRRDSHTVFANLP